MSCATRACERGEAVFCKKRRKNLLKALDELVEKLKTRMEATPSCASG
jgi:hypothetical protein